MKVIHVSSVKKTPCIDIGEREREREREMGRAPCCEKIGMKKGPWTPEEDQKLMNYIKEQGHGNWRTLPKKAGLQRCGKSCRLRWTNYLRADIKRGKFSLSEEQLIIHLHALLGNRWSAIATHLPKRTDNEIKNFWNTHLKKRLLNLGIDPVTHKPNPTATPAPTRAANSGHMAQWDCGAHATATATSTLLRTPPPHPRYSFWLSGMDPTLFEGKTRKTPQWQNSLLEWQNSPLATASSSSSSTLITETPQTIINSKSELATEITEDTYLPAFLQHIQEDDTLLWPIMSAITTNADYYTNPNTNPNTNPAASTALVAASSNSCSFRTQTLLSSSVDDLLLLLDPVCQLEEINPSVELEFDLDLGLGLDLDLDLDLDQALPSASSSSPANSSSSISALDCPPASSDEYWVSMLQSLMSHS